MKSVKLSPRDILIAAVVLVLATAVILTVVLIMPMNKRVNEVDAQINQVQQQISQNESVLKRRQEAKNRSAATATELVRLANAVPDNPELASLIIELQTTATESGLQFRALTPGQPAPAWQAQGKQPQPQYLKIPMRMQVFGTWADTVDFLERVQRLPRQLRVTRVDSLYQEQLPPQSPNPAPKVPILTEVGLEAYSIPESSTAAPAPAQVQ